jgi:hypothetical protein
MRETVSEYDVTVEQEEVEVERVYCDACGIDCEDSHAIVPMDLCSECQPDGKSSFESLKEYRAQLKDKETDSGISASEEIWMFTLLFPLMLLAGILDGLDGAPYGHTVIGVLLGALVWGGLGALILLALL